ncbi:MAG: helix-turn-helix domain-containing protein [Steroidobacteraceae bacterium]
MPKMTLGRSALPQPARAALRQLGTDLALARARRGQSLRDSAERLQVSINTVRNLEAGHPGVGLGILANALTLYGMLDRLGKLADPAADRVGLALERRKLEHKGAARKGALSFDV